MQKSIEATHISILTRISRWEDEHPYIFSFGISLVFVLYMLFSTPSLDTSSDNMISTENIQFIDIETIQAPKRITRQEVSEDASSPVEQSAPVERAVGTSDDANAVDMAFYPNIVPPKPIGKFKKIYPQIAREKEIEAVINVELLIGSNGVVKDVTVLGVRLSKELPTETYNDISRAFIRDTKKIFLGKQFTPAVVEGKKRPIKMDYSLRFTLEGLETGL